MGRRNVETLWDGTSPGRIEATILRCAMPSRVCFLLTTLEAEGLCFEERRLLTSVTQAGIVRNAATNSRVLLASSLLSTAFTIGLLGTSSDSVLTNFLHR